MKRNQVVIVAALAVVIGLGVGGVAGTPASDSSGGVAVVDQSTENICDVEDFRESSTIDDGHITGDCEVTAGVVKVTNESTVGTLRVGTGTAVVVTDGSAVEDLVRGTDTDVTVRDRSSVTLSGERTATERTDTRAEDVVVDSSVRVADGSTLQVCDREDFAEDITRSVRGGGSTQRCTVSVVESSNVTVVDGSAIEICDQEDFAEDIEAPVRNSGITQNCTFSASEESNVTVTDGSRIRGTNSTRGLYTNADADAGSRDRPSRTVQRDADMN
ncbi:hypothetical protein KTS45_01515 [Halomicroarcula limicola]|uniref:DUF3060 domain-containing protein n=1 Tax=Haloarcula limicola TaxID=1429915 RepID=A0A8J7Y2K7_9EURY|nr:hypothetical protein [Halomicroarcula limicola]MBV0922867.1 hypothetical protein [Halomicroarcula limicola]